MNALNSTALAQLRNYVESIQSVVELYNSSAALRYALANPDAPVPFVVAPEPRVFAMGQAIPADVLKVSRPNGTLLVRESADSYWRVEMSDVSFPDLGNFLFANEYPLTEVLPEPALVAVPEALSFSDAAEVLARRGIETGQKRLKSFLRHVARWTDETNTPLEHASDVLIVATAASPARDAVLRVTPQGINELWRLHKAAA